MNHTIPDKNEVVSKEEMNISRLRSSIIVVVLVVFQVTNNTFINSRCENKYLCLQVAFFRQHLNFVFLASNSQLGATYLTDY